MDCGNHLEHFSLRWNNYNDVMKSGFHDLLRREDFVDVTIAAEGKLIQAHKMVLSISSPYFKSIFKTNPCQHPVIFFKDVTHKELSCILQFIYSGEVSVQQEELEGFLKTAEALQIKGLTLEDTDNSTEIENNAVKEHKEQSNGNVTNEHRTTLVRLTDKIEMEKIKMSSTKNGLTTATVPMELSEAAVDQDDQESNILLKNEPPELDFSDVDCDRISVKGESIGISECQMQDNTFKINDAETNSTNTGNISEPSTSPVLTKKQGLCPICGRILQHKRNLQTHIIDQHSGIFGCWSCQVCHKVCRTWSSLRVHTKRHRMTLNARSRPLSFLGVTQQTN